MYLQNIAWVFQFWFEEVYSYDFVSLKFYVSFLEDVRKGQ